MHQEKLAILVAGGPAPGINSVISAATIRAQLEKVEVIGIHDGFEWIMQGDIEHVTPLTIDVVSRLHFRGGSHIGISRANPTLHEEHLENTIVSLQRLGATQLITIGGDDTAYSAHRLVQRSGGRLRVVHVPKTIDNDLDLPPYVDTFGFQTARHHGVEVVKNLMVDGKTTSRWYFVTAMGRKAGHLALGIGKSAGATLTLIPEEFAGRRIRLRTLVDTLAGAILKRRTAGRRDGVAVLAEGLILGIDPDGPEGAGACRAGRARQRAAGGDQHRRGAQDGRRAVRLREFGIKTTIVAKNIGYELRCADPIPADLDYTRDLGFCAARYVHAGGSAAMISIQAGQFVPIPFERLMDPETGRAKVRLVDINSSRYRIAYRYMLRLRRDDFDDESELANLAATAGTSAEAFRAAFGYVVEYEPPPLVLDLTRGFVLDNKPAPVEG